MSYSMLRNASVSITEGRNAKNHPVAIATINNNYRHTFDSNSRVSKALDTMSAQHLSQRLSGGNYFFVGTDLIDFRDGRYNGFVHDDSSISKLVDHVGITMVDDLDKRVKTNLITNDLILGSQWSNHAIDIPEYKEGGQYSSALHFTWNPFSQNINSMFLLTRQICSNGMVGLSSILNARIPLVNRWEEHLEIANKQIQNKVSGKVTRRLSVMGQERATVAECQSVVQHAQQRLIKGINDNETKIKLQNIIKAGSPSLHLGSIYKDSVFTDSNLGAQMPAHLSTYDIYNMATEVRSHSEETINSTGNALDKIANELVFNRKDLTKHAIRFTGAPKASSFSDPDQAFFGNVAVA